LLVVLLLALAIALPAFSQQRWERNYGGSGVEYSWCVQQTSDGGYIVAGGSTSFSYQSRVYLVKTNASGDTLWTRNYGGVDGEGAYSVQQTSDGGYIVAGVTYSFGDSGQVYLIKTNASGDTLWTKNYGGPGYDYSYSVRQSSDGGYIVTGETWSFGDSSQVYLIKTNASGDTLWSKTYGGSGHEYGYTALQTPDGGYIVSGRTTSFGNEGQFYLIKINASGDTLWTRAYGGAGDEWGTALQQTSDGGYVVSGSTNLYPGNHFYQVYMLKTNANGDSLWSKDYGGAEHEECLSVQQTLDGGYILAGETSSYGNGQQAYLIKTDASGDTLWTRIYGGAGNDVASSVQQTMDGGYIVAGQTYSFGNSGQVYLIKTDSLGRSTGVEETAEVRGQRLEIRLTAKPNPFTSFTTVPGPSSERFALYDISGRRVGTYKGDRVGEGLKTGVYFLRPQTSPSAPLRIVKVR